MKISKLLKEFVGIQIGRSLTGLCRTGREQVALGIALACGTLVFPSTLVAVPITYTVTDTATGALGQLSFTNQLVVIQFVGDTSSVSDNFGFYSNSNGTGTVSVAGSSAATITDLDVRFFDNQNFQGNGYAGIGTYQGEILATQNNAFKSYEGLTALLPTSGAVDYTDFQFPTTVGMLTLYTAGATSTFTATTVPEPALVALIGVPAAIALLRRRQKAV